MQFRMPKPRPNPLETAPMNWPWLRSFVAVLKTGSLTAAARHLNTTQPTVGRHIRALERQLGETLFDRQPDGLVPTARATEIYERAAAVEEAVSGLTASIGQASPQLSGLVRVTTSMVFAVELLPGLLQDLLRRHPALQVEVIASDDVRNLLRREADIAVRLVRPQQGEVIATKVGDVQMGLYARRDYLAREGTPTHADALRQHSLIGYEDAKATVDAMAQIGLTVAPAQVRVRSDNFLSQLAAIRAGCGIGACQLWLADRYPELQRVLPDAKPWQFPVWVAAHDDLNRSRRIRVVFDHLVAGLGGIMRG
jgi:DNA-binding transcriptional LysR family regulator